MSEIIKTKKIDTQLNTWAENLQKEVYNEWQKNKKHWKYKKVWKKGFGVFYGPISNKPKLMIISLNPGSKDNKSLKKDLKKFQKGDFSLPNNPPYSCKENTKKNRLTLKMRDLFGKYDSSLDKSVTFPLIFFRSKNLSEFKSSFEDKKKREEIEKFCYDKVNKIIEKVKPKRILVLGIDTHDKLEKHILTDMKKERNTLNSKDTSRIIIKSKCKKIDIFSIAHPTGSRICKEDWNKIKSQFRKYINPN